MIGFDLSDITNVYVGSAPQSAIYLGSLLVWPKDYSQTMLTFELLEPSQFAVVAQADLSGCSILYSVNNGSSWTDILTQGGTTPTFPAGTKIIWKGNLSRAVTNNTGGLITFDNEWYVYTSGKFKVLGNPASLYFGINTANYNIVYNNMYDCLFNGCKQLVSAKYMSLPATVLTSECYAHMFGGCTSLTAAPELPATTLAMGCYGAMFAFCSSLTKAPELPATTLAMGCYVDMFNECISLITAPELPATTLAIGCYSNMFNNCSSLNSITCLATDISAGNCTTNWVNNVAASGTFTKAASMTDWTTGTDGIPSGWTCLNY